MSHLSNDKPKHPGGRPLSYTKEIGDEICLKVATSPYGIGRICTENPHLPCKQVIFEWRLKIKEFGEQYTQAKRDQIEMFVDEIVDIADQTSNDTITKENKSGEEYEVCNSEWINRSRLRIDTRKWLAAKLAPKIYGDRVVKDDERDKQETSINELE